MIKSIKHKKTGLKILIKTFEIKFDNGFQMFYITGSIDERWDLKTTVSILIPETNVNDYELELLKPVINKDYF
jgi:hypothetical protein